jgi:hypothetical protein
MGCLRLLRPFDVGPLLHQRLAETVMVPAAPCMTTSLDNVCWQLPFCLGWGEANGVGLSAVG